ncbi:MAG: carbohydrate-binding protein, partial [Tepidisphaeraceae bacterium]
DQDATNTGGAYRDDGVDIYSPGAPVVGLTLPGEWLEYTVNVEQTGRYDLKVRAGASGTTARFHVEVDGADVSGPLVPYNSDFASRYGISSKDGIVLLGGQHVIRVVFDRVSSKETVGNFDWFSFAPSVQAPFPGPGPAELPGMIQMEDYDTGGEDTAYHDEDVVNIGGAYRNDGVDIYDGAVRVVGSTLPGEWLEYTVNVAQTGPYDLQVRCGANGDDATFYVLVDGSFAAGFLTTHDVNSDNDYGVVRYNGIRLTAGEHVIRFSFYQAATASGVVGEFDWFSFTPSVPPPWLSPSPDAGWFFHPFFGLFVLDGTVTFTGDAASTHQDLIVNVVSDANVVFESTQHLGAIYLADTARLTVAENGNLLVRVYDFWMYETATLDLNDNDLLVDFPGMSSGDFQWLINIGRAAGEWTGSGITSTSARNRPGSNTTLGVMRAADFKSIHGDDATFDGEPVTDSAVLVKYTYYGDADFDGQITLDDYALIDGGYLLNLTGWMNGDFDGSGGNPDLDDYSLIDGAFLTQSGTL